MGNRPAPVAVSSQQYTHHIFFNGRVLHCYFTGYGTLLYYRRVIWGVCMCADLFYIIWHNLESPERRKPQVTKRDLKMRLEGQAHCVPPPPRWWSWILCFLSKPLEASQWAALLRGFCLQIPVMCKILSWLPLTAVLWKCKPHTPFLPPVVFGHGVSSQR